MVKNVDEFILNAKKWQKELHLLRSILIECGLEENIKWRQPCYSFKGKNITIIGELKDACILSFFKGVLLKDDYKILIQPGENSQSARYIKFTKPDDVVKLKDIIKTYVFEIVELEKAGAKVEFKSNDTLNLPMELIEIFKKDTFFKSAFDALTPGRQRGYVLFFEAAKQSKTKIDRIEKYKSRILKGKGINDCVCGLSKKMPGCDGSHKNA